MSAGPGQAHEKAARSKSHKFQNLSLALQALHPQSKVVWSNSIMIIAVIAASPITAIFWSNDSGRTGFPGQASEMHGAWIATIQIVLPYVVLNGLEFAKEADPQQNTHVAYQASHLANTDRWTPSPVPVSVTSSFFNKTSGNRHGMVGTLKDKPLTKVSNSRYEHRLQLANETSNPVKYMIYIYIYIYILWTNDEQNRIQ